LTYRDYGGARQYDGKSLYNIHRVGTTGEIGTQLAIGLDPELYVAHLGDGGFDFETAGGSTVDVKSTQTNTERPVLAVSACTEEFADIYVLAHVFDFETVRIVGWCYGYEVHAKNPEPFPFENDNENYVVPQDELRVLE